MISFTEKAANKVLSIMDEQKVDDDTRVRVGVKGGGCSGFTYTVDFDSRKNRFDLEFESFGLNVLVDKKSHLYIKGTEIDWSKDLSAPGPRFQNPKAQSTCGCSTSFSIKQEETFTPAWLS